MDRTLKFAQSEEPAAAVAASVVAAAANRSPALRKRRQRREKMGQSVEDPDTPTEVATDSDATAVVVAPMESSSPVFAVFHS